MFWERGLANFFCKGPDSKYLRLSWVIGFLTSQPYSPCNSAIVVQKQYRWYVNEWVWLCSRKTLLQKQAGDQICQPVSGPRFVFKDKKTN